MTDRILYEGDSMCITYNPDNDIYNLNIGGRNFTSNIRTLEKIANTQEENLEETINGINPEMISELKNSNLNFAYLSSAISKAISKR